MVNEDEYLFDKALNLRDSNKSEEAIKVLKKIIKKYPNHEKIAGIYYVIAGIYSIKLNEYKKAIFFANKAKKAKPDNEQISLTIYIAFTKLEKYEKAIKEMIGFLKKNKADLYKTTIQELLEGLKDGYMTKYKVHILDMAKRNNITF